MSTISRSIITRKVEEENSKAEIIASLAQILFLAFILTVYLLSPKGFRNTSFEPVIFAFYVYAPILTLRLFLSLRRTLREWMIYVFLLFDVMVLTTLIWSFHIQYEAPLTLSLRSPTFLYFFIFMALRALSFRVAHVLFLMTAFLAAWAGMIWLAMSSSDLRLSKNFKDYIQPDTFILGVEIDKMLALSLVGVILGLSIYRKRQLLNRLAEQFVKEAAMESLLGKGVLSSFNLFDYDLSPGQVKSKIGATMVVDLRGFSRLSDLITSSELLVLLGEYQCIVAQRVFDCGGVVDKYLGDGVLAHFGIASEVPNFASSALQAAELVEEDLHTWVEKYKAKGIELGFGIAVAHGTVSFGVIGHPERMEITVLGESVNLAAKLEKHTKLIGHTILLDAKTYQAARDEGHECRLSIVNLENVSIPGISSSRNLVALARL